MRPEGTDLATHAAELRRVFDETFAKPTASAAEPGELLLAIRVGGDWACAIRVDEIAGLFQGRLVRTLPSPVAGFVGLAGIRGGIVPVYDLGLLLGYPAASASPWLALVKGTEGLAFVFESLESQVRAPRSQVVRTRSDPVQPHVEGSIEMAGIVRPILGLASLMGAVKGMVRPGHGTKER